MYQQAAPDEISVKNTPLIFINQSYICVCIQFYVLFLQIGAHNPLQSKEPKHSQNKLVHAHTHTVTHTHTLTHGQ